MKDDKGKVIFSLLAGATAGIVAGLLLAPETGDDACAGLRRSASKWGGSVGKFFKDAVAKATGSPTAPGHTNPDAAVSENKAAADQLLASMSSTPDEYDFDGSDSDYDGSASDGRYVGKL